MPDDRLKVQRAQTAVHPLGRVLTSAPDAQLRQRARAAQREIARLRALNARLTEEIAALRQREAQAQRLADRDGLTGLYNRRWLLNHLPAMLADAGERGERLGLLFLDLDGFKRVNDLHGHAVGDGLLAAVAARITARLRAADRACRFGGDEFVVLLPRLAVPEAAIQVAGAIRRRIALPYVLAGAEFHITASVGAACYPGHGDTAAELLHCADQGMFRSKETLERDTAMSDQAHSSRRPARRRDDPDSGSKNPVD